MTYPRRVRQHSGVTRITSTRPARALLIAFLLAGCGPTAQALRPTLAPGSESTAEPQASPGQGPILLPGGGESTVAPAPPEASPVGGSATPQPGGIAQVMAGFDAANAFEVDDATWDGTKYVAVGFGPMPDQSYFGTRQGVVWTSGDGVTWQAAPDAAFQNVSLTNVVPLGSNLYVFGDFSTCAQDLETECTDDPNAGTVVLRSANGGQWERLAEPAEITHATFDGVGTNGDTLVAWGSASDENETTTLWTSADGSMWTATTDLAGLDTVDTAGPGPSGLVAFGTQYVEELEDTKLVASSASDGTHFASANVPAMTTASLVNEIAGPGGAAAVGYAESDTSAAIGLAMFSSDGTNWTAASASDDSFRDGVLVDVHSSSSAYVAVGGTLDEDDPTLETGRVWVSADGRSWHSPGSFGGPFTQYGASALGPAGLVVFTEDQNDAENDIDITSTINAWLVPATALAP